MLGHVEHICIPTYTVFVYRHIQCVSEKVIKFGDACTDLLNTNIILSHLEGPVFNITGFIKYKEKLRRCSKSHIFTSE